MADGRNRTIDAFRGVAILMVMAFHYTVAWAPPHNVTDVTRLENTYSPALKAGATGVELFFVISGLVITMTALRARDAWDFAIRRFVRLYPAFLACASFTYVSLAIYDPAGLHVRLVDYLASLTFFPQVIGGRYVDGAYWSLTVEVTFYAFVALSLLFLKKRFWLGVLVVLLLGPALRPFSNRLATLFLADYSAFLLAGMAVWYWISERQRATAGSLATAAGLIYALSPTAPSQTAALVPIAILVCLLGLKVDRAFGPLSAIGRISYPLYLIHQVLGISLIRQVREWGAADVIAIGSAAAVSFAIAWLVHIAVEQPSQRLLMTWWRRTWPAYRSVEQDTLLAPAAHRVSA